MSIYILYLEFEYFSSIFYPSAAYRLRLYLCVYIYICVWWTVFMLIAYISDPTTPISRMEVFNRSLSFMNTNDANINTSPHPIANLNSNYIWIHMFRLLNITACPVSYIYIYICVYVFVCMYVCNYLYIYMCISVIVYYLYIFVYLFECICMLFVY